MPPVLPCNFCHPACDVSDIHDICLVQVSTIARFVMRDKVIGVCDYTLLLVNNPANAKFLDKSAFDMVASPNKEAGDAISS